MKRVLGWIITALALAFFVQRFVANASRMPVVTWNAETLAVAFVSVLLALAVIAISGAIWQILLQGQGIRRPSSSVLSLFLVAQFGKYLPGNVGQFVGRVVLARNIGVPVPVTLATVVIEVLWSIGTALGVSALAVVLFLGGRFATLPAWLDGVGLAMCFILLLASPWIIVTLAKRWFPKLTARLLGEQVVSPGWRSALLVSVLYVCNYLCMGLILQAHSHYLFGADPVPLLQVAGFFALAWLAGYLLPGAPAGLGVREAMMMLLFAPLFGEATAVALGITLRLTTTLADAVAFLVGSGWRLALARKGHGHE